MPENQEILQAFAQEEEARRLAALQKKGGKNKRDLAQGQRLKSGGHNLKKGDILSIARSKGFQIVEGNDHTEIISNEGNKMAVPGHGNGETIAVGTRNSIFKFLGIKSGKK